MRLRACKECAVTIVNCNTPFSSNQLERSPRRLGLAAALISSIDRLTHFPAEVDARYERRLCCALVSASFAACEARHAHQALRHVPGLPHFFHARSKSILPDIASCRALARSGSLVPTMLMLDTHAYAHTILHSSRQSVHMPCDICGLQRLWARQAYVRKGFHGGRQGSAANCAACSVQCKMRARWRPEASWKGCPLSGPGAHLSSDQSARLLGVDGLRRSRRSAVSGCHAGDVGEPYHLRTQLNRGVNRTPVKRVGSKSAAATEEAAPPPPRLVASQSHCAATPLVVHPSRPRSHHRHSILSNVVLISTSTLLPSIVVLNTLVPPLSSMSPAAVERFARQLPSHNKLSMLLSLLFVQPSSSRQSSPTLLMHSFLSCSMLYHCNWLVFVGCH